MDALQGTHRQGDVRVKTISRLAVPAPKPGDYFAEELGDWIGVHRVLAEAISASGSRRSSRCLRVGRRHIGALVFDAEGDFISSASSLPVSLARAAAFATNLGIYKRVLRQQEYALVC